MEVKKMKKRHVVWDFNAGDFVVSGKRCPR